MDNKYYTVKQSEPLEDPDKLSLRNAAYYRTNIESFKTLGFGQTPTLAPRPQLNLGPGQKRYHTPNVNASTIISNQVGNGGLTEGYGGQGITSPTIYQVAGHMGPYARETDDNGDPVLANLHAEVDAATFYVSALDNPDDKLQIPDGSIGNSRGLTSIAGIAEAIRFRSKGEGGIKLSVLSSNRDSKGQKSIVNGEINFITESDKEPQPLVLGDNLVEFLQQISEDVDNTRETLSSFIKLQGDLNDKVMNHNHNSPFYALTTAPSFNLIFEGLKSMFKRVAETEVSAINTIVNKETSQNNYLTPMQEKYILSARVKTT